MALNILVTFFSFQNEAKFVLPYPIYSAWEQSELLSLHSLASAFIICVIP